MGKSSESTTVKWFLVVGCVLCVGFAAWQVISAWRGPEPAKAAPNPGVQWGRPNSQNAQAAETAPRSGPSAK